MWDKIRFYFQHSFNDLKVNAQRTLFALLCIAAGVAAIVSLQTLAVMIGSTLQGNLQENNRGDIQVQPVIDFFEGDDDGIQTALDDGLLVEQTLSFFGQEFSQYAVSPAGLEAIQAWANDHTTSGTVELTYRQPVTNPASVFLGGGTGTTVINVATGEKVDQLSPVMIDGAVYPFYSDVQTVDGQPLADVLQSSTDVILTTDVADSIAVEVGDVVRLAGAETDFTVRGLVTTEMEVKNPATDIFAAMFGFYYLDHSAVELFADLEPSAETVYLKLAEGADVDAFDAALTAEFPFVQTTTTEDLSENYEALTENIDQLVSVMGLVSLLIGSIGIINTMQVVVRRRTVEIAVLKTMGLQANEVTLLFLVEALLIGLVGSIAGILLGWATVFVIRGVAESLLATELPFVIAPLPVINGLVVGTLVTMIFGFLPTLTAGQVRPAIVLRPTDNMVPRAGRLRTLGALLFILLALTLVAQSILNSFTTALAVTVGAFVAAGLLYLLLSFLIWLIGRFFPSFGLVDLRISLRQMLAGRRRAAVTLLALVIGVFSLSLITLMAQSITNLLDYALNEGSGGNVVITLASRGQLEPVQAILDEVEGVNSYQLLESYDLDLISLEEGSSGEVLTLDDLRDRMTPILEADPFSGAGEGPPGMRDDFELDWAQVLAEDLGSISAQEVADLPELNFVAGRQLTASDEGQQLLVIPDDTRIRAAGVDVGDKLTYVFPDDGGLLGAFTGGNDEPETITFEVVGISEESFATINLGSAASGGVTALVSAFPADRAPTNVSIIADVAEDQMAELQRELSSLPGVFALEISMLNQLISSLLGTFTAFPSMVAALGLVVGGVVIANSVALTTLERRREIAVMKAVGLQRERVLGMLLLENALLGLIGGLIGVGIGLFALTLLVAAISAPGATLPLGTAFLLMVLCVVVALFAALTTAWGASGEKPLNVLRYE
jgi:putative ABC transport system permease protein